MRPDYPPARRLDLVEEMHGHRVADPYRWLEDDDAAETKAWGAAQDALWAQAAARLPGRDAIRARLHELSVGYVSLPYAVGAREFFMRRRQGDEFAVLLVREAGGAERVLLDPSTLHDELLVTLDGAVPSKEGRRVAYYLSTGGDEEASLYVADVDTMHVVDGPIDRVRGGGVAWLPGGESFYYTRRLPPDAVPAGEEKLHRRVYLHRIGTDPANDVEVFGAGRDKSSFYAPLVTRDGRWLVMWTSTGGGRNDLYIADLEADAEFQTIHEGLDVRTTATVRDGVLYLFTTLGAPRGRIAWADPASPTPEHWSDLVAESDDVMTGANFTDQTIPVVRQRDVVSNITVHDRGTGGPLYSVDLPGLGSAYVTARQDGGDDFWIGYNDFFTPSEVWRHDTTTRRTELVERPPGADAPGEIVSTQVFFASKDGTRIPMFIVHRKDVVLDGANPTILYGYGGFNLSVMPTYSTVQRAWVERGGVYASANIRGGNEYGDEWHRAGMLDKKQNVFDDFIAAGEWLKDNGWTSTQKLAISGGSNGGLLVGAVLTQRPDLCRAVACAAPVLDVLRKQLHPAAGRVSINEYGDATVAEQFEFMYAYSPYHHVEEGVAYPAVLFTQGEADARVEPMQARKMCAALQHATTSDAPILLRREENVGHATRSMSRILGQQADVLAWLADQLGLEIAPGEAVTAAPSRRGA
jgi:prolyl oligopeptidase